MWGQSNPKRHEEKKPHSPILVPLFYLFYLLPLSLPYGNWANQEGYLLYLRFSGPWTFLCTIFTGFSLLCLLATAILNSFFPTLTTSHSPLKRWEAQFSGNRGAEASLATSCWTGIVRGIGPPPLPSLKLQCPYSSVHLGWVIFSMVGCRFIYRHWTGTECCILLTWAETKQVGQSIIHGTIISSINTVKTRISRGISQLQIPPNQEKDALKKDSSHLEISPAHSWWSCRIWMFFLRCVRLL